MPLLIHPQPLIDPISPALLSADIAQLPKQARLLAVGDFEVYCANAPCLPHALQEIGRLRELSFRAEGEGTGRPLDVDHYDELYQHLLLWHPPSQQLVGAYRLGDTTELLAKYGTRGLYTHSLFAFGPELFEPLGPSLEMGRSFVRPEWQGSTRALRLLWAGIAVLLEQRPHISCLFGPVSVSPRFSEFGRLLIMSTLQLHHTDPQLQRLISARNAPVNGSQDLHKAARQASQALADPVQLSKFLQHAEPGMPLPMLIKHYIELKGRFAGFNVDAAFNGTLDGLVFVRVQDIPAKMRARLTGTRPAPF